MEDKIKKQQIIDAAIEVIKEKGVEDATVREIANRAGLTTGAIYYYYKNKDELFYDVINQSVHFSHKISVMNESTIKNKDELLAEIKKEIGIRLSKTGEQKLYILLLSDVISKNGKMKEKYQTNYESIINNVADLYYFAFGVENNELKKIIAAILLAAVDGIAIQTSLGILPEDQESFIKVFNDFFAESIPLFLEKHLNK
ncbi:MAG TPA: TetR/AcrR family transcriptional regulator [Epulopiscium sp.]|nr:TetR/AcrR family transcriptional regulator [Candidatus Epulonipiscium sp.]